MRFYKSSVLITESKVGSPSYNAVKIVKYAESIWQH